MDILKLSPEVFLMLRTRPPYSPECRRKTVDLLRAGRYLGALRGSFSRRRSRFVACATRVAERRRSAFQAEAKMACFSHIEDRCNPVRLRSALKYRSTMAYEADMQTAGVDT